MELSIAIAKILSLTMLAIGLGALAGRIDFNKMAADFEKSAGLSFTSGVFTLILGAVLVNYHNVWVKDWPVLVTIIGWIALIKGILLIVYPPYIKIGKGIYKNPQVLGLIMLILGMLFGYFGFFA